MNGSHEIVDGPVRMPFTSWRAQPEVSGAGLGVHFKTDFMRRPSNLMTTTATVETAPSPSEPGPPPNYLDLYGLSKSPFGGTADSAGYILFGSHRRAFELLVDHLVNGSGVVFLEGEEGSGKTEALRSAATVAGETDLQVVIVSRPPNGRIRLPQLLSAIQGKSAGEETSVDDAIAHFLAPPRKALLVDDADMIPEDCLKLIVSLAQRIPSDPASPAPASPAPASPAILLSTSPGMAADPKRPEVAQLLGLARNTIRLTRLGPAEIRQYIERSLWIAGGTTRRLIATDAMKLIIARSGGLPGMTNRLMEGVLTAGFARGDPMITAKTVAATMGPTASRPPRHLERQCSGTAGAVMQIVAVGLLVSGAAAFLYQGVRGLSPSATSPTRATAPPAPSPAATLPVAPPAARPVETLSPDLMAALMKRGDQSLGLGDVAAARLLYQRAAEAGNAAAAIALGKTYDPNFATSGQTPDPARASEWYGKAIALGDPHGIDLLKRLGSR